ncbi:hypothetical protein OBBRIDRAFT_838876 [Obba rivulosa]|uniref:Uncharacterized protein n=1 Tax=Obba rivulosa TaxID=1052685 RepID=A0A8E2AJ69_9APHY|nr:hypothetical protein OBBRIDRAFT_838876 [Obba rivulosa]
MSSANATTFSLLAYLQGPLILTAEEFAALPSQWQAKLIRDSVFTRSDSMELCDPEVTILPPEVCDSLGQTLLKPQKARGNLQDITLVALVPGNPFLHPAYHPGGMPGPMEQTILATDNTDPVEQHKVIEGFPEGESARCYTGSSNITIRDIPQVESTEWTATPRCKVSPIVILMQITPPSVCNHQPQPAQLQQEYATDGIRQWQPQPVHGSEPYIGYSLNPLLPTGTPEVPENPSSHDDTPISDRDHRRPASKMTEREQTRAAVEEHRVGRPHATKPRLHYQLSTRAYAVEAGQSHATTASHGAPD